MIIQPKNLLDEVCLYKYEAVNKARQIIDASEYSSKMIKTASSGDINTDLIKLFASILESLNMKTKGDLNEIVSGINSSDSFDKKASIDKSSRERKDVIKIVSKAIKDSHYDIDVSKDVISHKGKELIMVSCYAKDAYLGRYLIKRNYLYTLNREKFADSAYDEIMTKMSDLKDRYYNDIVDVSAIFSQMKQVLDGVVSEIEMSEDSIGTNFKR